MDFSKRPPIANGDHFFGATPLMNLDRFFGCGPHYNFCFRRPGYPSAPKIVKNRIFFEIFFLKTPIKGEIG